MDGRSSDDIKELTQSIVDGGKLNLEIPMPSRVSLIGFVGGWIAVAALIEGFKILVQV